MALKKRKTAPPNDPFDNCEPDVEACNEMYEDEKYSSIAECAYYKAESRCFEPGHELDDWLAAEDEMKRQ